MGIREALGRSFRVVLAAEEEVAQVILEGLAARLAAGTVYLLRKWIATREGCMYWGC